jgi:hypothetical protein
VWATLISQDGEPAINYHALPVHSSWKYIQGQTKMIRRQMIVFKTKHGMSSAIALLDNDA